MERVEWIDEGEGLICGLAEEENARDSGTSEVALDLLRRGCLLHLGASEERRDGVVVVCAFVSLTVVGEAEDEMTVGDAEVLGMMSDGSESTNGKAGKSSLSFVVRGRMPENSKTPGAEDTSSGADSDDFDGTVMLDSCRTTSKGVQIACKSQACDRR